MDRVNQLRGEPGGSRDSTLDTTAAPSEGFLTANESSSKYFSLSEVDSTFDITPIKDVSLNSAANCEGSDPTLDLSPINKKDLLDSYRIGKLSEAANILSGGVDIFDDNDNSYDGDELVIDDNAELDKTSPEVKLKEAEAIPSKETEVVLQIEGKRVEAIDIGNGLYLYRKDGDQEELAAVQVVDPEQQPPNYKFLKVRENAEGNLEVYEEIEVLVPKTVPPATEVKPPGKNPSHVPIKNINQVTSDSSSSKPAQKAKLAPKEAVPQISTLTEIKSTTDLPKEQTDGLNGKIKFSEARKSPVISTFKPMTYHSTPNKEGIPLTKTMVDMQLHPGRHSDNVKKTIEVNTEICKKIVDTNISADLPTVTASEVPVNKSSKTDAVTVPEVKESVEMCDVLESTKTEINKELPKSLYFEKGYEKSSMSIVETEKSGTKKLNSAEVSSTTVAIVIPDTINKPDKISAKVENDANTAIQPETLQSKVNLATASAPEEPEVKTPSTSIVEVTPLGIKEVKITAIENTLDKPSKPVENKCLDIVNTTSKSPKKHNSMEVEKPKKIGDIAHVVDNKTGTVIENKVPDQIITEKLEQTLISKSETIPANIKNANLLTEKQGPSSLPSSNLLHKEVIRTKPASVVAPSLSDVAEERKPSVPSTNIAEEPKASGTAPKEAETKQTVTPEVKSFIAPIVVSAAEKPKSYEIPATEKPLSVEQIKVDVETKALNIESSKIEENNSSNDLIQLNDLEADLTTKSKARENLEKSLKTDISRLDQQLNTARANEEVVKPEINKTATVEKARPSASMFTGKIKPNFLIVKSETKNNITTVLNQTKPLDNSEFVKKHVSKAVFISPTNSAEQNKTSEVPIFSPESSNNAHQRPDVAKQDIPKVAAQVDSKPTSNNNNAPCNVPFGKWTEAHKQEYLHKIRETKVTTNNTSQLKQANDLNRRDVLKKIESQRQSNSIAAANAAKNHEIMLNHNKPCVKNETTVFISKPAVKIDVNSKIAMKTEVINKPDPTRVTTGPNLTITPILRPVETSVATSSSVAFGKKEPSPAFAAPNTANIANRETPSQYPFNLIKKDASRKNVTKRETATTSSANLIIVTPTVPIIAKKETSLPRATNLTKKDPISCSTANIAKVEIIPPPSNVAKKEIVRTNKHKMTTKNAAVSGMNLTKKEGQNPTKRETSSTSSSETKQDTDKIDPKKDSTRPTNQDLIDKTIEDYLLMERRPMTISREAKEAQIQKEKAEKGSSSRQKGHSSKTKKSPLDDIEMQMNELHGIPFIERPPHELPYRYSSESNTHSETESRPKVLPMSKVNKLPNLMPLLKAQDSKLKANYVEELSEEEIIEHEPITGDMELNKRSPKNKLQLPQTVTQSTSPKKDNVITENDFDKFVRRNSITYENCITVNYDSNKQHNVVQSVVGKDLPTNTQKGVPQNDMTQQLQILPQHQNKGISNSSRFVPIQPDDGYNANYHSKLQIAYQSALTAKEKNSPVTVLEDKPVKVVFVDNNAEFIPSQLNVQGKELSPSKRVGESEVITLHSCDSMDSEVLDASGGIKCQDGSRKHKHQRKQVLTPVEGPEPELIQPHDLDLEASPKKKRKTEDSSKGLSEKFYSKSVSKKTYILARSAPIIDEGSSLTETQRPINVTSAIDSLVKAAEMLENQSEKSNTTIDSQCSQPTPVKRGRGRPRKYPLPDGAVDKSPKLPTPQKKPRVEKKYDTSSEGSIDDEMVRENWTMGKINEDIVCPICNKLFRSENVVFKHVKHCTGPSPNRSDSGKRSRETRSQETDSKYRDESPDSMDLDMESQTTNKTNVSKGVSETTEELIQSSQIKSRRISEKRDHVPTKGNETRKSLHKAKATHKTNNLVCEFCGKTFRQLSYLVSHKIQHKNDECSSNKDASEKESDSNTKFASNVFSCEVCKKEFRKLHHLVQHRIIHNPPNIPPKLRKSSADNSEKVAVANIADSSKTAEDQSAGFRCEPCDKSFRKLHHLVEHRETHDCINRQKSTAVAQDSVEKQKVAPPPPQCDFCNKTFRKLHHLIEHKEQHADLNSDKSDDKSVKSALSTKDIIHECSHCYMVFPNEHSLTRHTVICQRKKRQSKQSKPETEDQTSQESTESVEDKSTEDVASKDEVEEKVPQEPEKVEVLQATSPKETDDEVKNYKAEVETPEIKETAKEVPEPIVKDVDMISETPIAKEVTAPKAKQQVTKATEPFTKPKPVVIDTIVIEDTPKKEKKTPQRGKIGTTVTKRHKTTNLVPLPALVENKPQSDDDEIRYMLNPNFKFDADVEEKIFMKVRGLKRNSLQIERPKSNLITRRISLQHPPRAARLKPKTEPALPKARKIDPVPSTDSDDSDAVKYSFPTPATDAAERKPGPKVAEKKVQRRSLADRRKSLAGIAKRKSVGKPLKVPDLKAAVKKRAPAAAAAHRCDCGQLFGSAALLSRHTSLAHTPPRIRRRRSPPPDSNKPATKLTKDSRKSSEPSVSKPTPVGTKAARKSVNQTRVEGTPKKGKVTASASKSRSVSGAATGAKLRRSAAHSGVPVPEKMRKLMEKLRK